MIVLQETLISTFFKLKKKNNQQNKERMKRNGIASHPQLPLLEMLLKYRVIEM